MSFAALAASSVSATAAEQHTFSRIPQMTSTREAPAENPMAGAEFNACTNRADSFELGSVDAGTFNDGMRVLSSIGSYYFERNVGTIEEQLARAGQYNASLENCSVDDLRVAAYMLNTWFPDMQIKADPMSPLLITARSFAIGELRQRLEQATVNERRSGI